VKSIALAWAEFSAPMEAAQANPEHIEAARLAFYSGAIFAMETIASIAKMPPKECSAAVQSLHDECWRFSDSLAVNGQG
jgi:hypothetical protein